MKTEITKTTKDEVIRLRVEASFKDAVQKAAELEERKLSDYIYRLIARDLKEKGLIK